jgi:hypothetical protein
MKGEWERIKTEKMWEECQSFYERNYGIKFKVMPKPKDVAFLHTSMNQLKESLEIHQKEARRYLQGLRASLVPEKRPRA